MSGDVSTSLLFFIPLLFILRADPFLYDLGAVLNQLFRAVSGRTGLLRQRVRIYMDNRVTGLDKERIEQARLCKAFGVFPYQVDIRESVYYYGYYDEKQYVEKKSSHLKITGSSGSSEHYLSTLRPEAKCFRFVPLPGRFPAGGVPAFGCFAESRSD